MFQKKERKKKRTTNSNLFPINQLIYIIYSFFAMIISQIYSTLKLNVYLKPSSDKQKRTEYGLLGRLAYCLVYKG